MKKAWIVFRMILLLLFFGASCNNRTDMETGESNSSNTFGDSIPVSNGLQGRVFLLPDTTTKLPDFDTMQSQANRIYIKQINIPSQSWSLGFPGMHNRFEWFGIEYTGNFKPNKSGNYLFKLVSDDGSLLFIDDSLFLNDDGLHSAQEVKGTIYLPAALHSIKLRYFQGPRYQLGLQLFWSNDAGKTWKIFPGTDFVLQAPRPANHWWIWLLAILIIMVVIGIKKENHKKVD